MAEIEKKLEQDWTQKTEEIKLKTKVDVTREIVPPLIQGVSSILQSLVETVATQQKKNHTALVQYINVQKASPSSSAPDTSHNHTGSNNNNSTNPSPAVENNPEVKHIGDDSTKVTSVPVEIEEDEEILKAALKSTQDRLAQLQAELLGMK
jgi:hypothetical protein